MDAGGVAASVLVVDDHAGFRASATALLKAEGYRVVGTAATGMDAVRQGRRLRPDLVLLDIRLPDIDGITVAERLAGLSPAPTVVLVSSRSASVYGHRLQTAPVHGFLSKATLSGAALRALLEEVPCAAPPRSLPHSSSPSD